jgi:NitT/TauT family transport system substrate-binding protein
MKNILKVAVAAGVLFAGVGNVALAQTPTTIALPAQSLLFAPVYIAQERGFFAKNGIDAKIIIAAGPAVVPALIGRSADFTTISGAIHLAAAARGQTLLAIGNTQDKITTDIVVRADVAKKFNVPANADFATKMKALKGLTIGVDAINGLPHSVIRFLAVKAGMDPEKDLTITALQPPAMLAALKVGTIDAFAFSPPFSLLAVNEGNVLWIDGPKVELPEFKSFPYNVVLVRPDFCDANKDRCQGFMNALKEAITLMKRDPQASLQSLAKTFDKMDPATLKQSFEVFAPFQQDDMKLSPEMFKNGVAFSTIGGILPADAKLDVSKLYSTTFSPK